MAGYNFGGLFGGSSPTMISGPQFEQNPTTLKLVTYSFVGLGEETVYTVPAGKTLYLGKVLLINAAAGASIWDFEINGNLVYKTTTSAATTQEIDFPIPIAITTGLIISCTVNSLSNKIALVGWEV
mgnify:CR=1 FL=1